MPTTAATAATAAGRDAALNAACAWFDDGRLFADLATRVAARTESDRPGNEAALAAYLDGVMAPGLRALGFDCRVVPNPLGGAARGAGPFLIARRIEDRVLPTVLSYAHGDVVAGHDGQWRDGRSPWTLAADGERWYGRGTADNKGQHAINLAALAAVLDVRDGRLGYNLTLLVETGEEAGSPGLRELCAAEREALAAQLFLASDGPRVAAQRPTLFLGARGAVNFSLRLRCRERGLHSGNWGGVVTNPATVVANALAALVDGQGRMKVEALKPPPIPPAVRAALARVPVGDGAGDPALAAVWGEPGLSAAERLFGWNTIEVLAFGAGAPQRPVNAIPPEAVAHCQLRFVVGTDAANLRTHVERHLAGHGFGDVEVEVKGHGDATRLALDDPWVDWALGSMRRSTGVEPVLLPNLAGSLPNELFADGLGLPTLWVPHSYPGCSQHAPDEHLLAPVARQALPLMAGLWWDLGEPDAPWRTAR